MHESETIRDGIGMERCLFCGSALRNLADEPVLSVRVSDVEQLIVLLEQYVECPEVWGETQQRLERACGKTAEQIIRTDLAKVGIK